MRPDCGKEVPRASRLREGSAAYVPPAGRKCRVRLDCHLLISSLPAARWRRSSAPCVPAASGQAVRTPLPPAAQGVPAAGGPPAAPAGGRAPCNELDI